MRHWRFWLLIAGISGGLSATAALQQPESACTRWQACRDAAETAAHDGRFERFHDLAWRTVQLGPPRDPALLLLLARAQSMSGRPHDALVMIQRIVDLRGDVSLALTSDDFARMRALPAWAELAGRIADETSRAQPGLDASARRIATLAPSTTTRPVREVAALPAKQADVREALRFRTADGLGGGLAYDAVSHRFLFGAAAARKVVVVGDGRDEVVDLVRASSAAFADISALAIDARRGDLWVASGSPAAGVTSGGGDAALHKLQLISGRPLARFTFPKERPGLRIVDLAVARDGAVLALDAGHGGIWRLPRQGGAVARVVELEGLRVRSLAATDTDGRVFVAHDDGLVAVDLATGRTTAVEGDAEQEFNDLVSIRWMNGRLVAVQRTSEGTRILSLRVTRQNRMTDVGWLEGTAGTDRTLALTVAGADIYYAAMRASETNTQPSPEGPETIVWHVAVP
ncbi:MAG: hypothetical protein AB7I50_16450 [Vicinamibacterales bacterium]